ncbi:MAG: AAA-like domain-containing protein [Chloroflexota bacterium]
MRRFNTSGPCDPKKHYTVLRQNLIAEGQKIVEAGRYFTLFAPRQAGKTTYFQLLLEHLKSQEYTPLWISFEGLGGLPLERFYVGVNRYLQLEFEKCNIKIDGVVIRDHLSLRSYLEEVSKQSSSIVLVIDEFEEVSPEALHGIMHTFRAMYHKREEHGLQSLVLAGVSTLVELILESASPFNVTDQVEVPYFSHEEVGELIKMHVEESGQHFDDEVIRAIYVNTSGQPGLVNALCEYITTKIVPDKSLPVTVDAFYTTLKHFLTHHLDKNVVNIVQKAKQKREFMLRVLFGNEPIPFVRSDDTIAFLYAHGVIDNVDGYVDITVPLYAKTLIAAFRPLLNGESRYFIESVTDTFQQYVTPDGLDLNAMLKRYEAYVRRRGFRAFDTEQLREGAWHYSLDGFINFLVNDLGGDTLVETPTGRGRTDILVLYRNHKQIIETKVFTTPSRFENGKVQLATYLATEELAERYYVVFSNAHSETDQLYFDEVIEGKRIYTHIIRTKFEQASRAKAPKVDEDDA